MQLALTADGDLDKSRGRFQLVEKRQAALQAWRIALKTFRGEWHLDNRVGFPWMETIFKDRPSRLLFRSKLAELARRIPGVVSVERIELREDRQARRISGTAIGKFEDGDTIRFATYEPRVEMGS